MTVRSWSECATKGHRSDRQTQKPAKRKGGKEQFDLTYFRKIEIIGQDGCGGAGERKKCKVFCSLANITINIP